MLKTDGVLYLAVPASNAIDHGFYSFSPGLFYDYFNSNGLKVLGCYLKEGSPLFYKKKGNLYKYNGIGNEIPIISSSYMEVITIAKKIQFIEKATNPTQSVYLNEFSQEVDDSNSKKRNFFKLLAKILIMFQNFLPSQFEIFIAKYKTKLGKNNITFIKKI